MPDTANNAPPLAATTSLAEGIEVLQGLDANGYDYAVIGVAAHIVLETARGQQTSPGASRPVWRPWAMSRTRPRSTR